MRLGEVRRNLGMILAQLSRRGVVAIAFFGDCQADDPHGGVGHCIEQRFRVLRRNEKFADGADQAQMLAHAGADRHSVETVLRIEGVGCGGSSQAGAANRPACLACPEAIVEVDGLMGAVKGADAEMDDPDARRSNVVGGTLTRLRNPVES